MFGSFDFQEFLSAFIVLFAVIDIIGSIPIILNLKQKGRNVNANKATGISFALLIGFFYAGDMMLKLFQVDIASFAVAGFEAEEILSAIYALVKTIDKGEGLGTVMNLYKSVVRQERNEKAFDIVNKYFVPCSASWRGLGKIESSGLILRDEYNRFDAGSANLTADFSKSKGCMCGEIITGKKTPSECPLFKKVCTPENPMGACMVSGEGTCFNLFVND